ncbi:MAG: hypothetical protein HZB46_16650 [Solirubrobacterales bacterium]|nr:hypothetical protein [Solirubrobacterales bacterium]
MGRRLLATLLAAPLAGAPPASADVRIDPERVEVRAEGGTATITRDPLRIAFADASGTVVLREVDGAGARPLPVAPVPSPVPLGQDAVRAPALYAPLHFSVGTGAVVQAPAAQYVGNLVTGLQAGVSYSATRVLTARADGDAAELTVATTDPTGRTLRVRVAPAPNGALRVSAAPSDPTGVVAVGDAFDAAPGEAYRGFGGRHNAIDQRGEDFVNWTQQENTGSGYAASGPDDRTLFPNGRTAAYYVQSLFASSAGYGFLLDRDELSRWRIGSDDPRRWQVQVAAGRLDYEVFPARDPAEAIRRLTATNGRHRAPPDWALGGLWDAAVRYPADNPADYLASVRRDLEDFDRYGTPVEGYRIEGWEFLSRDQLRELIGELRRRGIHPLLYFRAFVGRDQIGTDRPSAFDEAVAKGYVAMRADGSPYTFISNFQAEAALLDVTDPAAVRWWQGRIREALELGADGFMQDFGEQTLADMRFEDGSTGLEMHNRFGKLFHRITREEVDRWEREHPGANIWFFVRTGYSGTPGSAASEGATFAGDGTTDFSRSSGLASQTPDMLNRAVGGAWGFTTDVGGYFDIGPYPKTSEELLDRWAAWAALSPYFRLHGSVLNGPHRPWDYGEDMAARYNAYTRLHLAARPLLRRLLREAQRTGTPPLRPLWLAAPGDPAAAREDQEWLLGDDVLVAPVVEQGARGREVTFPGGCWRSPESGLEVRGPARREVAAGLGELPYFFRCGTAPFAAAARGGATLPARRACRSRRAFRIHLRARGVAAVRVYVNGRRVRASRRGARVDLRGLPRRRVTVRILTLTRDGRRRVATRTYRTCVPRRR